MATVDLTNNGDGSTEVTEMSTTDCWRLCGKEAGGAAAVMRLLVKRAAAAGLLGGTAALVRSC